jgi:hypothetical protein
MSGSDLRGLTGRGNPINPLAPTPAHNPSSWRRSLTIPAVLPADPPMAFFFIEHYALSFVTLSVIQQALF